MSKTSAQNFRQKQRDRRGRYDKNPCYGCGKGAPMEYYSHALTDCLSPKGENWADLALVLCGRCCRATADMTEPAEFRSYQQSKKAGRR